MQKLKEQQQHQDNQMQNLRSEAGNQNNRMFRRRSSAFINKQITNHKLRNITVVLTFFTIVFVLFIIWTFSELSKTQHKINKHNFELKSVQSEKEENLNEKQSNQQIKETVNQAESFISQFNINNQPADFFFAKYLNKQSFNQNEEQLKHLRQIKYYTKLYGKQFAQTRKELPLCVITTGRNNMELYRQKRFLDSISKMNYKNFKFVYVDDASEDSTFYFTKQYVKNSKQLLLNSFLVLRDNRFYALANKIKAIQQYCQEDDIIIDVDADDKFIGREVFNVINYLYTKNQNKWFIYTNHLMVNNGQFSIGKNRGLNQTEFQSYRVSDLWVTSHLKTFRKKLFKKIDQRDWKNSEGQIYHWASDRYLLFSLIELAGPQHTQFQNVVLYLYDFGAAGNVRNFQIIRPDKIRSQLLTPYQKLQSLNSEAVKKQNYDPPANLKQSLRRAQLKYEKLKENGVQE